VAEPASRRRSAAQTAKAPVAAVRDAGPRTAAPPARWADAPQDRADSLLHDRTRLGLVAALAGSDALTFVELKTLLDTTDGNLSVHARKLEDAGFVTCRKTFADRRPRSEYRLTAAGRRALQRYLDHMEALIEHTRRGMKR
jgi:DNA-binding MarR family transcriptional regulator